MMIINLTPTLISIIVFVLAVQVLDAIPTSFQDLPPDMRNAVFENLDGVSAAAMRETGKEASENQILKDKLKQLPRDGKNLLAQPHPYYYAIVEKNLPGEIVASFLKRHGKDINQEFTKLKVEMDNVVCGRGVLARAISNGRGDRVDELLKAGADPNVRKFFSQDPPLFAACQTGDDRVFEKLLNAGADPNVIGYDRRTVYQDAMISILRLAAQLNRTEQVKQLIQVGAEVNEKYRTALHEAALYGNAAVAKILLEAGTDVKISGVRGTALHEAASSGNTAIAKMLLEAGADANAQEYDFGFHRVAKPADLADWYSHHETAAMIRNHPLERLYQKARGQKRNLLQFFSTYIGLRTQPK